MIRFQFPFILLQDLIRKFLLCAGNFYPLFPVGTLFQWLVYQAAYLGIFLFLFLMRGMKRNVLTRLIKVRSECCWFSHSAHTPQGKLQSMLNSLIESTFDELIFCGTFEFQMVTVVKVLQNKYRAIKLWKILVCRLQTSRSKSFLIS